MVKIHRPTGIERVPSRQPISLPTSLAGVTVGIVDNTKPQADFVLGWLADRLVSEHGAAGVTKIRKASEGLEAEPEELDWLATTVHLAVGGLAE